MSDIDQIPVGCVAVAEPAQFAVPSAGDWVAVEGPAGLLQFSLYGVLVGPIHGRTGRCAP